MYKYASVIGGEPNLKVKVGSLEELKYFSVMPCLKGEAGKHSEKVFYLSPKFYPGYENMMATENGRRKIQEWEERRANYITETEEKEYNTINKSSVIIK